MERDLLIEGSPADLEELRQQIERGLGRDAHLEPVTSSADGEYREPFLIGLIVALGGPPVVKGVVDIINRFMEHREQMKKLANAQQAADQREVHLIILEGESRRSISPAELRSLE